MQSILDGKSPVRRSEQQAVDCVSDACGCDGGWMDEAFNYWKTTGVMTNAEYPYTASEGTCMAPTSTSDVINVGSSGQVTTSTSDVVSQL